LELSTENLVVIISVGVTAGWLGYIVRGTGFGLLSDFAIGIVGALVGDWLLPRFGDGIGAVITNAAIGAVVLVLIIKFASGGTGWRGGLKWGWRRRWLGLW
jgi:uncharacterized membrane protein YeaQ/YmgE (transglycosylase-associated protein family)